MVSIRGLVPFYSGDGGFKRASKATERERYLKLTIESLKKFDVLVRVYTCTRADFETAKKYCDDVVKVKNRPLDLIYNMVTSEQGKIQEDYVVYTDSDHVIIGTMLPLLKYPIYAVPHRLEEVGTEDSKKRGPIYVHNGKEYVIINSSPPGIIKRNIPAYSGMYVCTTKLFNEIKFKNDKPENPAGFDIFDCPPSVCMKFSNFYVEHLSGRDYNETYHC